MKIDECVNDRNASLKDYGLHRHIIRKYNISNIGSIETCDGLIQRLNDSKILAYSFCKDPSMGFGKLCCQYCKS